MHPELYLAIYRRSERELEQRLEHRRAALERAAVTAGPVVRRAPARAGIARTSRTLSAAGSRLAGAVGRGRHALDRASATGACCSPA